MQSVFSAMHHGEFFFLFFFIEFDLNLCSFVIQCADLQLIINDIPFCTQLLLACLAFCLENKALE